MRRGLHALLSPLGLLVAVTVAAVLPVPDPSPAPPVAEPATGPGRPAALRPVALPPPTVRATAVPSAARPPVGVRNPPDADPAGPALRPSAADAGRGLLLLDRVRQGDGPSVEIAWPDDRAARETLRRHLRHCAGWQALLLADGRLWRAADPPGTPWRSPVGSVSGLLRRLDGPAADPAAAAAIRARHGLAGGRPVAAVARRWDARLLGGLARLLGPGATGARVQARYALDGGRLTVVEIRAAGRPVPGTVDLGPVSECRG